MTVLLKHCLQQKIDNLNEIGRFHSKIPFRLRPHDDSQFRTLKGL